MKIAIIGSGIAGLTAAYYLQHEDITVFEKDSRIGGHTATVDVNLSGQDYAIDTGFIVFNDWTYPNFIRLMDEIGVAAQNTQMSFSVSCKQTGLEYAGSNLNGLFAQRSNIVKPYFLTLIKDILRFNKNAPKDLEKGLSNEQTLGQYLSANQYSQAFAQHYLVPMGAAIWSSSSDEMLDFPLAFFIRFFKNHGLLNIFNRPQWKTIIGGSRSYLGPLTKGFSERIKCNSQIKSVERLGEGVALHFADGSTENFDKVIFACHSDQALALLKNPSQAEQEILSAIEYRENDVVLHTDETLLPNKKRAWCSWNYHLRTLKQEKPTLTYHMNTLQNIQSPHNFCVSLNSQNLIDENKVLGRFNYSHPQFSVAGCKAQNRWAEINKNSTWFCGAYWHNGFHEDGVASALRVVNQLTETNASNILLKPQEHA